MTRPYQLRRRAEQRVLTRDRIVAAARDLYLERGMAGTSMLAVARAADVAPNTVRNHFPTSLDLAAAVGAEVLVEVELPEPSVFDGATGLRDRLERLSEALAAVSRRGDAWWAVMQREPELAAAWTTLEQAYDARLEGLIGVALGPLAADAEARAVVATTIGPATFYGLQQRGVSADAARRIGLELAIAWLEDRPGG